MSELLYRGKPVGRSRPPKHVQIGPHRYRVHLLDAALPDAGCDGICSKDRLSIAVYAEQAQSKVADTLLHEIGHALLSSVKLEEDVEEAVCLALGPGLLGLIRDNSKLIDWVRSL